MGTKIMDWTRWTRWYIWKSWEFFNNGDNNNANLTFSDIQAYIKKLKSEEGKLQDEIQGLKDLKQDLEIETAALEKLRDQTSKMYPIIMYIGTWVREFFVDCGKRKPILQITSNVSNSVPVKVFSSRFSTFLLCTPTL
jgi:hypothetical protein